MNRTTDHSAYEEKKLRILGREKEEKRNYGFYTDRNRWTELRVSLYDGTVMQRMDSLTERGKGFFVLESERYKCEKFYWNFIFIGGGIKA